MAYKVAVVGATGNVGREMLGVLAERKFPVSEVYAVASARTAGGEVSFGENDVLKFILGRFKRDELDELKKIFKTISEAIESIVTEGREIAMNKFN